ncbi:MAG: hypothetical protein HOD23_05575 [Proteobacteria bacterium]|nr:hypothetical protein [Pseudomonadota bacterium]MBT6065662.1 hypothetical protein [Pseudomonadota bacterium]MDB4826834.1 hypothetical protein [Gammaproteobacteria bacterium]
MSVNKQSKAMFDLNRQMKFHLEITDKCNAACPMCGRTQQSNRCLPDMSKVKNIDLDLETIKRNFTPELCANILEIDLCGGLGDPLAARDCFSICEYFVDQGVKLILSTNAGLRSVDWWRSLGELFARDNSVVEFHIDGLADTNHLYRVNTRFTKIMANAAAYLETGSVGEWHFIPFQHNQHQINAALELSREMGFANFKVIDTIRFGKENAFGYQMPDGTLRSLKPADPQFIGAQAESADSSGVEEVITASDFIPGISCKSENENRPYIVATGAVSACCWVEGSEDERQMYLLAGQDHDDHNINDRLLSDILTEEPYVSMFAKAWASQSNPVCIRKCGHMRRSRRRVL